MSAWKHVWIDKLRLEMLAFAVFWTQNKAYSFTWADTEFSYVSVLCIGIAEITFTRLPDGKRKELTIFLLVSFHLFYRCNTLKQKSPSLHLNFVSHDFISDCGHLGSWSFVSTLIKWKTITQRSQLSGSFPYRDLKTGGFFSVWLSLVLFRSTTEINYFLLPVHHIILESMTTPCGITCTGTYWLLQWLQELAEQNVWWKIVKNGEHSARNQAILNIPKKLKKKKCLPLLD